MDVKILVEPLRERLFILTEEGSLTYADSRAIIVCPDDLPFHQLRKPHLIYTQNYLILEHGELLPYEEKRKKGIAFTKSEFEHNPDQRERTLRILYNYVSEYYDPEDLETLVTEIQDMMKEMAYYDITKYEKEITKVFTSSLEDKRNKSNDINEGQSAD